MFERQCLSKVDVQLLCLILKILQFIPTFELSKRLASPVATAVHREVSV